MEAWRRIDMGTDRDIGAYRQRDRETYRIIQTSGHIECDTKG